MITNPTVRQLPARECPRRIHGVSDVPRARLPWVLVAGSLLLAALLAYTLFGGYLPAKRRVASLERELRQLYLRVAELQTKVAQNEQRHAVREQQLIAVSAERDALARRLEDVERQLAVARGQKR